MKSSTESPLELKLPLSKEILQTLSVGQHVLLTGPVFTMRDAGHLRTLEHLKTAGELPSILKGATLFYAGPTPEPKEGVLGSIGPTTASRMDFATPTLFKEGVVAAIGKGPRSLAVAKSCASESCVCFSAVGGAAAYLSSCVDSSEVIMWEDLGCEALRKLMLNRFPVVVTVDTKGVLFDPASQTDEKSNKIKNTPHKGLFITFEGTDGSGKSTHVELLANRLREKGLDPLVVREPGGTPLSEKVRNLLLYEEDLQVSAKTELLLFEAARSQLIDDVIAPALNEGKIVLCDRFTDSTVAYQGYARGINIESIHKLNDFATSDLRPDKTIFLCLDSALSLERATQESADRLEGEGATFQEKVYKGFAKEAALNSERIAVIETAEDKEITASRIDEVLRDLINPFFDK